jgi:hypothetical protein
MIVAGMGALTLAGMEEEEEGRQRAETRVDSISASVRHRSLIYLSATSMSYEATRTPRSLKR